MSTPISTSTPIIRRARPGDEPGIHEAHMRSIREVCSKDYGEDEIRGWGNRPLGDRWIGAVRDGHVWVIEQDARIRGVSYIQIREEKGDIRAHIHALYLAPEVIGLGLGLQLARLMLDQANNAGARTVTLEATLTAHDFYKRLGFRDSGPMVRKEIGGSHVRGFPMKLQLG